MIMEKHCKFCPCVEENNHKFRKSEKSLISLISRVKNFVNMYMREKIANFVSRPAEITHMSTFSEFAQLLISPKRRREKVTNFVNQRRKKSLIAHEKIREIRENIHDKKIVNFAHSSKKKRARIS